VGDIMLKINKEKVKRYKGIDVPYTLIRNGENSRNLTIFLPGAVSFCTGNHFLFVVLCQNTLNNLYNPLE
jgi:hypothetical protein